MPDPARPGLSVLGAVAEFGFWLAVIAVVGVFVVAVLQRRWGVALVVVLMVLVLIGGYSQSPPWWVLVLWDGLVLFVAARFARSLEWGSGSDADSDVTAARVVPRRPERRQWTEDDL